MSAPLDRALVPPALQDPAALEALAAEYGTPLFVYDEDELRRRCREYADRFGGGNVAYAGKAFLCTTMAQVVAEEGLHLDVATGGELHVALQCRFPARPGRLPRQQQERPRSSHKRSTPAWAASSPTRSTSSTVWRSSRLRARFGPTCSSGRRREWRRTRTSSSRRGLTSRNSVSRSRTASPGRLPYGWRAARRWSSPACTATSGRRCSSSSPTASATEIVAAARSRDRAGDGIAGPRAEPRGRARGALPARRPRSRRGRVRGRAARCDEAAVAAAGLRSVPRMMVEPGRSIAGPAGDHAVPGRDGQGDPGRPRPTSRSTAA